MLVKRFDEGELLLSVTLSTRIEMFQSQRDIVYIASEWNAQQVGKKFQ